jgi:signal transduction histidine kinase
MQILVDVGRFARMLLNLVKNSIEAMPNGGILRIAVRKQGAQVMFRISDTGCGIEPELQAKIFEPFVTFGKSKGTGLGMAIVKSVVEAHGGTISVHSEVGVGTSIEVSVAEAPSPAGAAA